MSDATDFGLQDTELLERLAELEHAQWIDWSRAVASEVSSERLNRWEQYWKPYDILDEEVKEKDRIWARLVLRTITSAGYKLVRS